MKAPTKWQLADLSLFLATPEQTVESRKRSAQEWRRALTEEQYILRDIIMDEHEHAAHGKGATWVLAPRANPSTLDFMCSCETFRRAGLVCRLSTSLHAEEVTAYGIASVFTPLEKRRCGYAQHMMRLLHWVLAPRSTLSADFPDAWGAPPAAPDGFGNAQFSVLYSDVGPDFYRLCGPTQYPGNGWIERGSTLTSWNVPPSEDTLSSKVLSSTWKYLTEDDAIRVWEADAAWMKIYLANMRPSTSHTCFTFLPNQGVAKFLIHRTMSFNKDLTPVLPLQTWGILRLPHANAGLEDVLGDDERQGSTFATWSLDPTSASGTLIVTRLRATTDTFPELFGRLTEFSREQKIERIEIWALPETLQGIASDLGGVTEQRQEHLSAFKWYGKEPEELEWIFDEKFCWC